MSVDCQRVPDRLEPYHPYAAAYRRAGSRLFRDFGPHDPRDPEAVVAAARAFDWPGDRAALAHHLGAHLAGLDAPDAARANAERLGEDGAVAVVTGHQPVLFGGPLHVLWKILTTLAICRDLNRRQNGVAFVPVFWNGSEDHNRDEFGRIALFDPHHDLAHVALPDAPDAPADRMAAATPADEAAPALDEAAAVLPETDFHAALFERLRACYAEGDLGRAFGRFLLTAFGGEGLVVVEPRTLRAPAAGVLRQALEERDAVRAGMERDTAEMEERGYAPQLPLPAADRTLVYHVDDDGARRRIWVDGGDGGERFRVEGSDRSWTAEALYRALEDAPQAFSPSAALRPLAQGRALPAAVYVAGGGELAYHVQIRSLFARFGVTPPLMAPRAAGTLLKSSTAKAARKLELDAADLLAPGWDWDAVAERAGSRGAERREAFDRFRAETEDAFTSLAEGLRRAGCANLNELDRERERFLDRIRGLEERFDKQDPTVGEGAKRQYWRLRKFVLPAEALQELSVAWIYFLCLFGPDLPQRLADGLDPWSTEHHVFTVD